MFEILEALGRIFMSSVTNRNKLTFYSEAGWRYTKSVL